MGLSLTLDGQPVVGYSNLQIKNIARGGFASVTFNLNRKLDKGLLASFTNVMVYDTATGEQVGGGRLMEQGRNDDGQWQITCLGEGLASMQDREELYALIDQTMSNWVRISRTTKRLDASVGVYPGQSDDDPNLFMEGTQEDKNAVAGAGVIMAYRVAELVGKNLGGIGYRTRSGSVASANWRTTLLSYAANLSGVGTVRDDAWSTTLSASRIQAVIGGALPAGRKGIGFWWRRITTDQAITEDTWSVARDVIVQFQLLDKTRSLVTSGYTIENVRMDQAFTDWVASYCPRLDIENAVVEQSTHPFDQIAYTDSGITGMGMMEDLLEVEPAFNWAVWERNDTGRWTTEFRALPTTVRYEASVDDGFSAPSPTTEVYNKVTVVGKSPAGRTVSVVRTSTVPDLDAAGITRAATIDLGTEVWSVANAVKRGDSFLAEHAVAPNAGTITIARKIRDNQTGRMVEPWNIRSGGLMRVRGIQPTPDTLNATSPDGVTVFRLVSATYDDDQGQAVCELDTYELTTSRAIAALARARVRK